MLRIGHEDKAKEFRFGLEPGDTFRRVYETPPGFCPASFTTIFVPEVVRCNGDLEYLCRPDPREIDRAS